MSQEEGTDYLPISLDESDLNANIRVLIRNCSSHCLLVVLNFDAFVLSGFTVYVRDYKGSLLLRSLCKSNFH